MDLIEAKRCALRIKPPTLVLLYFDHNSGKQRRRSMPLRGIGKDTNIAMFASNLQKHPHHSPYFQAIPTQQLHSLLERVKEAYSENQSSHASSAPSSHHSNTHSWEQLMETPIAESIKENVQIQEPMTTNGKKEHENEPLLDLPPLNDAQHAAVPPNQMLDHLLWPVIEGHHGLISQNTGTLTLSDEAVESVVSPLLSVQPITTFHTKLSDCSNKFSSNDNIEDVLPAEDRSLSFNVETVVSSENNEGGLSAVESDPERDQLNSLSLTSPDIVTGDNSETSGSNEKDLNRVSEQTLFQTKATMDVLFEANRVHPGEDGWQYDRQEDFGPAQMESGWDSDSSSTKEF